MKSKEKKVQYCTITVKGRDKEEFTNLINWVTVLLGQYDINIIANGGQFISDASLPFQASLGLDVTEEQAMLVIRLMAHISTGPKFRAGQHVNPDTGKGELCKAAIDCIYHVDFKDHPRSYRYKRYIPEEYKS